MFRAGLNAPGAFDAVRIILNLIYGKLHRTHLLAFAAFNAFLEINL
jgi:hypothetical protein